MRCIKAKSDIRASVSTSMGRLMPDRNFSSQLPEDKGDEPPLDAYRDPTTKSAKPVSAESSKTKATHKDFTRVDGQAYMPFAYFDLSALLIPQDRSSKSPECASKTPSIASSDATEVSRRDSLSQVRLASQVKSEHITDLKPTEAS
jgi:hypothetical protein